MKKIAIIFTLTLLIVLDVKGQRSDNPILPRIYEDGYTLEQIKSFALENTEYSKNYRTTLLFIVNSALRKSGEHLSFNQGKELMNTKEDIGLIYRYVVRKQNGALPIGYQNTFRQNSLVLRYKSRTPYYGPIDQFVFGSCVINLDKPSCANLLGDLDLSEVQPGFFEKETSVIVPQGEQPSTLEPETDFVFSKPKVDLVQTQGPFVPTGVVPQKRKGLFWKIIVPIVLGTIGYLLWQNSSGAVDAVVPAGVPGGAPPTGG